MAVFDNAAFDEHERVLFCRDAGSGLRAIIALHSTALGPAAGGCRAWTYESDDAAITDALRLARGMSYKNAMAELAHGGGKAVMMKPAGAPLSDAMLEAFGGFVNSLGGSYITAEDVGMSVAAMQVVARRTPHVAGLPPKAGAAGGDPSPKTAYGVYCGMLAAVADRLGRDSLDGLAVAVQGVGNVGYHLCRYLNDAGCRLHVADIDTARVERVCDEMGASAATLDAVLFEDVDILAPCALGAVLNRASIPKIRASVIAGAANNQLACDADGERLSERDVLYCPDYVINAGGIINVASEHEGNVSDEAVRQRIEAIGPRLARIFAEARTAGLPTNVVADTQARRLIGR